MSKKPIECLNALADRCHTDAKNLGWYDKGKTKTDVEAIMLMVTELAECVEELRKPEPQIEYHNHRWVPVVGKVVDRKPEGVGVELADCLIRILDWAAYKDIDLDTLVNEKLAYNLTRGTRHGNKRF